MTDWKPGDFVDAACPHASTRTSRSLVCNVCWCNRAVALDAALLAADGHTKSYKAQLAEAEQRVETLVNLEHATRKELGEWRVKTEHAEQARDQQTIVSADLTVAKRKLEAKLAKAEQRAEDWALASQEDRQRAANLTSNLTNADHDGMLYQTRIARLEAHNALLRAALKSGMSSDGHFGECVALGPPADENCSSQCAQVRCALASDGSAVAGCGVCSACAASDSDPALCTAGMREEQADD